VKGNEEDAKGMRQTKAQLFFRLYFKIYAEIMDMETMAMETMVTETMVTEITVTETMAITEQRKKADEKCVRCVADVKHNHKPRVHGRKNPEQM
jgi:hypothetical protein